MQIPMQNVLETFTLTSSIGKSHDTTHSQRPSLPGGTPLRLCSASNDNDLFQISSVELTKQPVYTEDVLLMNIYGKFENTWQGNGTWNITRDCGSNCDLYGVRPGEPQGASWDADKNGICWLIDIEQPRGGHQNSTCPPVPGEALVTAELYAWRWVVPFGGWWNYTFDALTDDGHRIFCLTAEVCLNWEDPDDIRGGVERKGPWTNCTWPY